MIEHSPVMLLGGAPNQAEFSSNFACNENKVEEEI